MTSPIQQSISGSMTAVCPMNYVNMLGYKGPICAHITNGFLTETECTMLIRMYRSHGRTRYEFVAPHFGCEFRSK